jgi:hypothetical protein
MCPLDGTHMSKIWQICCYWRMDAMTSRSTDSSSTAQPRHGRRRALPRTRGDDRGLRCRAHSEGHGLRYDTDGRVIGVTIINARRLLDCDGHVTITLPQEVQVAAGDLAVALS